MSLLGETSLTRWSINQHREKLLDSCTRSFFWAEDGYDVNNIVWANTRGKLYRSLQTAADSIQQQARLDRQ